MSCACVSTTLFSIDVLTENQFCSKTGFYKKSKLQYKQIFQIMSAISKNKAISFYFFEFFLTTNCWASDVFSLVSKNPIILCGWVSISMTREWSNKSRTFSYVKVSARKSINPIEIFLNHIFPLKFCYCESWIRL